MSAPAPDRRAIQCNYAVGTNVAPVGARAYVLNPNNGGGHDRVEILVRSRGARWVRKWEDRRRLGDFRVRTIPPEHPLYERLQYAPVWAGDEDLAERLNRA